MSWSSIAYQHFPPFRYPTNAYWYYRIDVEVTCWNVMRVDFRSYLLSPGSSRRSRRTCTCLKKQNKTSRTAKGSSFIDTLKNIWSIIRTVRQTHSQLSGVCFVHVSVNIETEINPSALLLSCWLYSVRVAVHLCVLIFIKIDEEIVYLLSRKAISYPVQSLFLEFGVWHRCCIYIKA